MMQFVFPRKGFSIIELLVVISIIVVSVGFGFGNYGLRRSQEELNGFTTELQSQLEYARSRSLANEVPAGCTSANFLGYGISTTLTSTVNLLYNCSGVYSTIQSFNLSTKYRNVSMTNVSPFYFRKSTSELEGVAQTITVTHGTSSKISYFCISKSGRIAVYAAATACT